MAFTVSFKYRIKSFDCDAQVPYLDFEYTSRKYSKSQADGYVDALLRRVIECPHISIWDLKVTEA